MYLMYVDESGDSGVVNSPTNYFILTAIVVNELHWKTTLEKLVKLREQLKETKGLKLREEIHSVHFINKPGELKRIKRNDRLDILKKCIDWINSQEVLSVFSVVVDKTNKCEDVFEIAWNTLITRFEMTMKNKNFPVQNGIDEKGIILSDNTDGKKLTEIIRKMRHYNPIPNKTDLYSSGYSNIPLEYVIEDPIFRDSQNSLLHQMNDVAAYCARQIFEPNNYMKKKGGHRFYTRLNKVSLKVVSTKNQDGIVLI